MPCNSNTIQDDVEIEEVGIQEEVPSNSHTIQDDVETEEVGDMLPCENAIQNKKRKRGVLTKGKKRNPIERNVNCDDNSSSKNNVRRSERKGRPTKIFDC